jgi:hypothetical protein
LGWSLSASAAIQHKSRFNPTPQEEAFGSNATGKAVEPNELVKDGENLVLSKENIPIQIRLNFFLFLMYYM